MSHYCVVQMELTSEEAILQALVELGFKREQVELHQEAVNLYGYRGDMRPEKANIIIRKEVAGIGSNDVGFVKGADGKYISIISEFDQKNKYGEKWVNSLKQYYGVALAEKKLKQRGYRVSREIKEDKTIRLLARRG